MTLPYHNVRVIDTHTGGEPTRVVFNGGPDLGDGPLIERVRQMQRDADHFRRMMISEPRGSEAMVGALLCPPTDPSCVAAVIFFNNRDYLGMCGHGTIGVAVAMAYAGRIEPGLHQLETPVGVITFHLSGANEVSIDNVPSYRLLHRVAVEVDGLGVIHGDVAWGGNWFFLAESPLPLSRPHLNELCQAAQDVRDALRNQGIGGVGGAEIDHVEFFGPPESPDANSRNFVYCPGGAYDRSPCGTGTSAKLACLAADGKLQPGELWVQESIIGSRFVGKYQTSISGTIIPTITGTAYVYGECQFVLQAGDPFPHGIT
ncbi:proline racemase family protein [Allorhodopirellula solitaria]|uniref:4-hydroxyproline epimerase n=1 Tax=Allorhodopirellula solitaria TaxID=2527987 RepID=A0A5C5XUC1_9BACT|nr:proline racemase family protein [Allorhodopirellula solitaria]TWT66484.1 4-hydroxyproline epimerase [Allorhodopirellula solitaria]